MNSPESADLPTSLSQRLQPRYTLRTLLLIMTAIGVFLGAWNAPNCLWSDAWRAAVTFLVVCGLAEQARDWWRADRTLSRARRNWEIGWRCAVALSLIFFAGEKICERVYQDWFGELEFFFFFQNNTTCGWLLTLLIAISAAPATEVQATEIRADRRQRLVYSSLAILAALIPVYFTVGDMGLLEYLVAVAITGVQHNRPTHWGGQAFPLQSPNTQEWGTFHVIGYVAVLLLATCWVAGWLVLKTQHRASRWFLVALWIALIGGLIYLNLQADSLMWQIYPHRQSKLFVPYYIGNLLLIVAVFTAAAVVFLLRDSGPRPAAESEISPLLPFGSYWHERPIPLLLTLVIAALPIVGVFVQLTQSHFRFGSSLWNFARGLMEMLTMPIVLLSIACVARIAQNLWRLRCPLAARQRPAIAARLPVLHAGLLALAIVAQVFVTLFTLYWTSAAIVSGW
ncbi:hypothetical protein [Anatilimnocola floriformis]|uniref:hypothetical protein n=1 Tax=Anatilimnocola floriformis TaxID=2948575 RepID=UPI0020C55D2B|nr:hypothetical protein [Anatilimnocola floriformis]